MRSTAPIALALLVLVPAATRPAGAAITFTDIGAGLTGFYEASLAWGD